MQLPQRLRARRRAAEATDGRAGRTDLGVHRQRLGLCSVLAHVPVHEAHGRLHPALSAVLHSEELHVLWHTHHLQEGVGDRRALPRGVEADADAAHEHVHRPADGERKVLGGAGAAVVERCRATAVHELGATRPQTAPRREEVHLIERLSHVRGKDLHLLLVPAQPVLQQVVLADGHHALNNAHHRVRPRLLLAVLARATVGAEVDHLAEPVEPEPRLQCAQVSTRLLVQDEALRHVGGSTLRHREVVSKEGHFLFFPGGNKPINPHASAGRRRGRSWTS